MQAYTDVGDGDVSNAMLINTVDLPPLPVLLISTKDAIFIQDTDIKEKYSLVNGITMPTEISFLLEEKKIVWINKLKELFMLNLSNSSKHHKILEFKNNPLSLTVDWVARILYIVIAKENDHGCSIYKLDLNYVDRNIVKSEEVLSRNFTIGKIEMSPFTRYVSKCY